MDLEPRLLVLGAGTAGNACARAVAASGQRVVVVERARVGGLCLWAGCMPKKALYNAATAVRHVRRMEQFGIGDGRAEVDWSSVLAWKWHAQETYAGDQEAIAAERGVEILAGDARFTSPDTVAVGDAEYRPESVLIATGSVPVTLDLPGVDLTDTSNEALGYPELPSSLAIVGGGFVAMEFAGIFASFGTRVSVFLRGDRPLGDFDPDLVDIAAGALRELGVEFIPHSAVSGFSGGPGAVVVQYSNGEGTPSSLTAERVLLAVGRRPDLAGLDLESGGIDTDERGRVVVDAHLRTSNPRAWVAGDAAGGPQFTPVASAQGSMVAEALLTGTLPDLDYSYVPAAVFTVPQLATVGLTEHAARERDIAFRVARQTFDYVGAAVISDERKGLVKILVSQDDDRILGAHIAAPAASDLIYPYALALRGGLTAAEIAETRAVHPAMTEALNWVAW